MYSWEKRKSSYPFDTNDHQLNLRMNILLQKDRKVYYQYNSCDSKNHVQCSRSGILNFENSSHILADLQVYE